MSHHEWWKSNAGLSTTDHGVQEHETAMKASNDGLRYDQVDASNLSFMEHLLRRAQLIEHYHKEKVRAKQEGADGKAKGQIGLEEQELFMGARGAAGYVMIAPALIEHVSRELERQASIDKQARKAREERALHR